MFLIDSVLLAIASVAPAAKRVVGLAEGEVAVACFVDQGLELVVAELAVMMSGAVLVPMDPTYPGDRLRHMIIDCGAPIVRRVHVFNRY